MKRIRIGKDIAIRWNITLPEGTTETLKDMDLSVVMKDPRGNKVRLAEYTVNDYNLEIGLAGKSFAYLGSYTLTLWKNLGEIGQSVVDAVNAFELVGSTEQEDEGCNCGCGALDVSTVDLYGDLTFPIIEGPKGDKGDKGEPGEQGEPGKDGEDGQPGFSPIATISKSGDTATITITDKNGTTTATIRDGSDASISIDPTPTQNSNNAVSSGGVYNAIANIPTPTPEIFWCTYGTTTAAEIQAALDAGKAVMCKRDTFIYTLTDNNATQFRFFSFYNISTFRSFGVMKSNNTWGGISQHSSLLTSDKITSTSSTNPDDNKVYSALATKNLVGAVNNKIGQPVSFNYTYTDNTTVTYNLLTSNS